MGGPVTDDQGCQQIGQGGRMHGYDENHRQNRHWDHDRNTDPVASADANSSNVAVITALE